MIQYLVGTVSNESTGISTAGYGSEISRPLDSSLTEDVEVHSVGMICLAKDTEGFMSERR